MIEFKPKNPDDWAIEWSITEANNPVVHGQMLPIPFKRQIIQRIQEDAVKAAFRQAEYEVRKMAGIPGLVASDYANKILSLI